MRSSLDVRFILSRHITGSEWHNALTSTETRLCAHAELRSVSGRWKYVGCGLFAEHFVHHYGLGPSHAEIVWDGVALCPEREPPGAPPSTWNLRMPGPYEEQRVWLGQTVLSVRDDAPTPDLSQVPPPDLSAHAFLALRLDGAALSLGETASRGIWVARGWQDANECFWPWLWLVYSQRKDRAERHMAMSCGIIAQYRVNDAGFALAVGLCAKAAHAIALSLSGCIRETVVSKDGLSEREYAVVHRAFGDLPSFGFD